MQRIRLLPVVAAILLVLATAADVQAGQYGLAYDFSSDLSGWSGYVEPGYVLCGHGATAGCADVSTNRILANAGSGQAIWSQGRWEWTAPPGTTIVGGALAYRTRMLHPQFFARVKMRGDGVEWDAAPTLVSEQHTAALTDHVLPLAGGFRQIGVALYAHPATAGVVPGVWDDYVTLVRLDVTVDDAVPPALAWVDGGGLLDGAWHQGDVCATLAIADGQSGVGTVSLASDGVATGWGAPATGSQYQPGIAGAQPSLCLSSASLGDGIHAGAVSGADASGGAAAPLPFTVRVDRTPPVSSLVSPGATAPDALPAIELAVGDATSGVSAVGMQLDGTAVALDVSAGRATGRPATALAYGAHALTWYVLDTAGNRTDGSAHFDVPDTTAPAFGAPQPADGAALAAGGRLDRRGRRRRRWLGSRSRLRPAAARRQPHRAPLAGRGSGARHRRLAFDRRSAPPRAQARRPRGQRCASRLGCHGRGGAWRERRQRACRWRIGTGRNRRDCTRICRRGGAQARRGGRPGSRRAHRSGPTPHRRHPVARPAAPPHRAAPALRSCGAEG